MLTVIDGAEEAGPIDELEGIDTLRALVVERAGLAVGDGAGDAVHAGVETETRQTNGADVVLGAGLTVQHCAGERLAGTVDVFVVGLAGSAHAGRGTVGAELDVAFDAGTVQSLEPAHADRAEIGSITRFAVGDVAADAGSVDHEEPFVAGGAHLRVGLASVGHAVGVVADKLASVVDEVVATLAGLAYISRGTTGAVGDVASDADVSGAQGEPCGTVVADVAGGTSLTVGDVAT